MFFYTFMKKLFNMSLTASVAIALVVLKAMKDLDRTEVWEWKKQRN